MKFDFELFYSILAFITGITGVFILVGFWIEEAYKKLSAFKSSLFLLGATILVLSSAFLAGLASGYSYE